MYPVYVHAILLLYVDLYIILDKKRYNKLISISVLSKKQRTENQQRSIIDKMFIGKTGINVFGAIPHVIGINRSFTGLRF